MRLTNQPSSCASCYEIFCYLTAQHFTLEKLTLSSDVTSPTVGFGKCMDRRIPMVH